MEKQLDDRGLNYLVSTLLRVPREYRSFDNWAWADSLDWALDEWESRQPGTRPPAYANVEVPACFTGKVTPIYEWPEAEKKHNVSARQLSGV